MSPETEAAVVTLKYPGTAALPWRPNQTVLPCRRTPPLLSPPPALPGQIPSRLATARRSSAVAGSPSPHHLHYHQAMDLFPHGAFVRLESRGKRDKYLHADGDWIGVSLRPLGGGATALEAVWRVEQLGENQGGVFLVLQNAAYGRYLTYSPLQADPGHRGRRAVQADRTEVADPALNASLWWWRPERVDPNQDYVRLRYADTLFYLRANGKYLTGNTGVTVAINRRRRLTTMMQWTVHQVPESPVPLPLPVAPPEPQQQQGGRRGPGVHQYLGRTIRHVRASDEGNFLQDHRYWRTLAFFDHSVINLRQELGQLQDDWNDLKQDANAYTLCIQFGSYGRLMPLVTDLPRSLDPMNIVVLRTGSPAAAALVYPKIDAPAQ